MKASNWRSLSPRHSLPAIKVSVTSNIIQTLVGTILGLGTAALLGWTLFATTVRLDLRRFFQVTGFLLILFAAGLIAHGVHEFNEVGWIPSVVEHVWDMNAIVDENSLPGQLLKTLFGYNGNPSLYGNDLLFCLSRSCDSPLETGYDPRRKHSNLPGIEYLTNENRLTGLK